MKKSLYITLTAALLQTTSLYGATGGAGDINPLTNPRAFVYNPQDASGVKDQRVDALKEAQFKFQEAVRDLRQIGERFTTYVGEVAGVCGGTFDLPLIDAHMVKEMGNIRERAVVWEGGDIRKRLATSLDPILKAITDNKLNEDENNNLRKSLKNKILSLFDAVAERYDSIWNPLLPDARIIEDFLGRTELNEDRIHLKAVYSDNGEEASSVAILGRRGVSFDAICDMLNRAGAVRTEYETALALHPFFAFPMQPLILWLSDTDHFYHYDTGSRQFTRREFPLSWRGLFDSYARGAGPEERLRAEAAVIADIATDKQLLAPTTVTVETLPAPSYGAGRMVLYSKTDIVNAANRRAGLDLLAHDAGVGAAGAGAPRVADGRDALADAEAKRIKIAASQFTAEEFEGLVALGSEIEGIARTTHDATESVMRYGSLAKRDVSPGLSHGESTKRLLANQLRKRHSPLVESSLTVLKGWFSTLLTDLNKTGEIGEINRALDYTNTKANTPDASDAESKPFNRQFIEALWELRSFYEGHRAVLVSNQELRDDFNVRLDFLLDTIKAHYDHCPQGAIGRALWTRYILCQFIADHGAMLNGARAALPAAGDVAVGGGGAGASALTAGPVVGGVLPAVKLAQTSAAMPVAPGFTAAAVAAAPAGWGGGARAPLGDAWAGAGAFATATTAYVPAPVAAGGLWAQPASAVAPAAVALPWDALTAAPAGGAGAPPPRSLGSRPLTVHGILSKSQYKESIMDAKVLFSETLEDLIVAGSFSEALRLTELPEALLAELKSVGVNTDEKVVNAIQTYDLATVTAAAAARRDAEAQRAMEARRIAELEAAERAAAEDAARRAAELEAARIDAEVRAAERAAAEAEHLRTADEARRLGEIEVAEIEAAEALAQGRYRIDHLPEAFRNVAREHWSKLRTPLTEHEYANRIRTYLEAYPSTTPVSLVMQMRFW